MGSLVNARCTCGYAHQDIMIGGGFLDFQTSCSFPVLCKKCQKLVTANLLDKHPACPHCKSIDVVPYDQKELVKVLGKNIVASWYVEKIGRDLELTDGRYYCPSCREYNLTFESTDILWD